MAETLRRKKATIISKPEVINAIKTSRYPVMIVGHLVMETRVNDREMIDYLIDLGKTRRIPIIATGKTNCELLNRGYMHAVSMSAIDACNRLSDREWRGPDGNGPYDLAIFVGLPRQIEQMILSGLMHSAPYLRTLSLKCNGHYYQSLSALPRISGPCSWISCLSPGQVYRSLVFRPEIQGKTERSNRT
jgi:acetyl-CoA decarbonylase/synthase complex subunit epsilon